MFSYTRHMVLLQLQSDVYMAVGNEREWWPRLCNLAHAHVANFTCMSIQGFATNSQTCIPCLADEPPSTQGSNANPFSARCLPS
jgi:hypothetical protein